MVSFTYKCNCANLSAVAWPDNHNCWPNVTVGKNIKLDTRSILSFQRSSELLPVRFRGNVSCCRLTPTNHGRSNEGVIVREKGSVFSDEVPWYRCITATGYIVSLTKWFASWFIALFDANGRRNDCWCSFTVSIWIDSRTVCINIFNSFVSLSFS